MTGCRHPLALAAALVFSTGAIAAATAPATGFQLERYEPAPAGDGFFEVEAPWYVSARLLAVGLTFDEGHNVLLGGSYDSSGAFHAQTAIISNQLVGHLDVALSPLDRLQLSASLPMILVETGSGGYGVVPLSGAAFGDLRLGAAVRLLGDLEHDLFSLHLSGRLWVPVGATQTHAGDIHARGSVSAIAGGMIGARLQWVAVAGVGIRPQQSLSEFAGGPGTVGSELQGSAALAYVDAPQHFRAGPELVFDTAFVGPRAFRSDTTHLEALLGGSYTVAHLIQVGPAVGFGIARGVGTPDFRALLRVAYAPEPVPPTAPIELAAPDRDRDGVADGQDVCPDEPEGAHPDSARRGCPLPAVAEPAPRPPEPAPAKAEGPAPAKAEEPAPAKTEEPAPAKTEEPAPAKTEEPVAAPAHPLPVQLPKAAPLSLPSGCREAPGYPDGHRLATVWFELNQALLGADAEATLGPVAAALAAAPELTVRIDGSTDVSGPEPFNQDLSVRRAQAVAQFLRARGVAAGQLHTGGSAAADPICPSDTHAQRAANRRATVVLENPTAVPRSSAQGAKR